MRPADRTGPAFLFVRPALLYFEQDNDEGEEGE